MAKSNFDRSLPCVLQYRAGKLGGGALPDRKGREGQIALALHHRAQSGLLGRLCGQLGGLRLYIGHAFTAA